MCTKTDTCWFERNVWKQTIPHTQPENSYCKSKNISLKIVHYLVIRASTWSVKTHVQTLTVWVRILTLDTIPVRNLPSPSAAFYKNLWKILVFIPLQGNFQTSKIFIEWENTFSSIPVDEDRSKT